MLANDCTVYRLLLAGGSFDKKTGKPLSGGFKRRPPKPDGTLRDQSGLSVCQSDTNDVSTLAKRWDPKAIVSLLVGDIRSIKTPPSLDVIPDKPNHANIVNLPAGGEDEDKAELIATYLRDACIVVYSP